MRHSQYNAYGAEIARRNKKIAHQRGVSGQCRFVRIVVTTDDYGNDNISEWIEGLRNELATPFVIWIAYEHQFSDNGGEQARKHYRCSFLLCTDAPQNKFDAEDAAYDHLEEIGEEILAFIKADFEGSMNDPLYQGPKLYLKLPEAGGSKLGRVQEYLTMRFDWAFWRNYNGPLHHNPDHWIS